MRCRLIKKLSILSLLVLLLQASCGSAIPDKFSEGKPKDVDSGKSTATEYQQIVETIRSIVGKQLDLNAREVDVDAPLSRQKKAADELDVVEIVMHVEETFHIEISDEEVGGSMEEVSRELSVKKLADLVSKKKSLK